MEWPYRLGYLGGRFVFFCTMRLHLIRPEAARRKGPYLIACTHLSHLEPFLLGVLVPRQIDWITRIEFYKYHFLAWILRGLSAIEVRRFGVPVSTIRTAIKRLKQGRVVGICPEGGVAKGKDSCIRGGPIKKGVCLISYRTGVPVLPVVILGADRLNSVPPWLPAKRARLWVAFSDRVIEPRQDLERRAARQVMADELRQEYVKLFNELKQTFGVAEASVP
jgi:1-acyl-sn-glycerol-3-phosphate acyltransferase